MAPKATYNPKCSQTIRAIRDVKRIKTERITHAVGDRSKDAWDKTSLEDAVTELANRLIRIATGN